jgi:hypothetical protein
VSGFEVAESIEAGIHYTVKNEDTKKAADFRQPSFHALQYFEY